MSSLNPPTTHTTIDVPLTGDSCFQHDARKVLHSNEPLHPTEAAIVKDYMGTRKAQLEENRGKLADLTVQLASLMARKAELTRMITEDEDRVLACEKRLATSISILPTEILEIVFSYSVPVALSLCTRHAFTYKDQPPFSLVQVCRRWRFLALQMPALWATFHVRSYNGSRLRIPDFSAYKEMVKTHLRRAADLPKSVEVSIDPQKLSGGFSDLTNPASAVFNDDIKIQHLTLHSPDLNGLLEALGQPSSWWKVDTLDAVESLVLLCSEEGTLEEVEIFSPVRLPSLRRLSLRSGKSITDDLLEAYSLPWGKLTHIAITSWIPYRDWVDYLPDFKCLTHGMFYLKQEDGYTPETEDGFSLTFHHLRDLTLIFRNDDSATISLPRYKYPSLAQLRLGAYAWECGVVVPAFDVKSLERTEGLASLTSLALHHLSWEAQHSTVLDFLTATKNLRKLSLGISTNYDAILAQFQIDWDGFAILPRLEEFTIDCTPSGYGGRVHTNPIRLILTSDGFTGMVKDRWRPVEGIAQLKKAELFLMTGYERLLKAVVTNLKEEVGEGLVLKAKTTKRPQWEDPLSGTITHWHEGLVLPQVPDCGSCMKGLRQS